MYGTLWNYLKKIAATNSNNQINQQNQVTNISNGFQHPQQHVLMVLRIRNSCFSGGLQRDPQVGRHSSGGHTMLEPQQRERVPHVDRIHQRADLVLPLDEALCAHQQPTFRS